MLACLHPFLWIQYNRCGLKRQKRHKYSPIILTVETLKKSLLCTVNMLSAMENRSFSRKISGGTCPQKSSLSKNGMGTVIHIQTPMIKIKFLHIC